MSGLMPLSNSESFSLKIIFIPVLQAKRDIVFLKCQLNKVTEHPPFQNVRRASWSCCGLNVVHAHFKHLI